MMGSNSMGPSTTPIGPSTDPFDVDFSTGDDFDFSSDEPTEEEIAEAAAILSGMVLFGGLVCGALMLLLVVGFVVLIIAIAKPKKQPQTRYRYS